MPVNPDIIFILLYFQKKVYRQSEARRDSTACFFAIGQIYFDIFQTSAGAIALFEDGQYHLVSQRKPLSKYFCADIDKEMVR